MARLRIRWESLPESLRDLAAFQPVILHIMQVRFPRPQYLHQVIGTAEYRVREGILHGLNVQLWREEDLFIDVSAACRLDSALPVLAALLSVLGIFLGLHLLEPRAGLDFQKPKSTLHLTLAAGTVLWLVLWGLLALLAGPFGRDATPKSLEWEVLEEMRRRLPPGVEEIL